METKTTNFLTEQSKALINNLIYTLQSLKDEQITQSDAVIVAKQLNNLVNELNASLYSKENVAAGSRISVLFPHAYPSVQEKIAINFLNSNIVSDTENTKNIVEDKLDETVIDDANEVEKTPEIIAEEEKQITPEVKEGAEETPDVIVIAPPSEIEEAPMPKMDSVVVELPKEEPITPEIVEENSVTTAKEEIIKEEKEPESGNYFSLWETFTSNDVPTLLHQDGVEPEKKEGTSFAQNSSEELNPIKDLKKSISINDRYLFINELFRGDESTYERSIKTINGFNIYQEANFWIERELKVKLGWNEKDPTVRDFMQLVKRRFL
ncbi:hypothetical protein [Rhizosphaericola mali]|uniref:Uncharacterized protein n=1 Tax=Rhizosphaericola mali TaxID=2545455 RepID=A0A5P2FVP5_9BACT|nr:hypothetical protein [Rhizosphaericola mali]QES87215.1 hypothetical protein E0W69_000570 [Rhizosphaericola mali]